MGRKPANQQDDNEEIIIEPESMYTSESLAQKIDLIRAELGIEGTADATVHVSKLDADGKGNEANVWRGEPEQYDLEVLAKKFGSGEYRMKLYIKNPAIGKKVVAANEKFRWLLSPEDEAIRQKYLQEMANPPAPISHSQPDVMGVVREMMTGFQTTVSQLLATVAANQPKEKDPMQTLEGIKSLAQIIAPPREKERDSFGDTMRMVDSMLSLQSKLNPPKLTDDNGDMNVPALVLSVVKELRNMKPQAAQPATIEQPKTEQIAGPVAIEGITPEQQAEIDEMNLMLTIQLKAANRAASKDANPADYAASVYGIIPDDVLQMIANDPTWIDELTKINPDCAKYRAWYTQVGATIVEMMKEDGLLLTAPTEPGIVQESATTPIGDSVVNTNAGNGIKGS